MKLPPAEAGFATRFIETPLRRVLEWAVSVGTIHPSTHRLKNALGLTVGMVGGRYVMDRAVGETPDGDKVEREDVPFIFRPIHGTFAHNQYSDDASQRVKHVMNLWIPAMTGATGAYLGSYDYAFNDQAFASDAKAGIKNAKTFTLDKAEDAAMAAQSKVWRLAAGMTAPFGSSANLSLLPGPWNYGSDLSVAFQGTVARNKLHTPYLKMLQQLINNNNHPYAYGPSSMATRMRGYLAQNPDKEPEQARKMAYAVLEPWYGERVTEEHITEFLKPGMEARERLKGEPLALKKEMEKFYAGEGLERTMMDIGLDPATAMVGRNGMVEYAAAAFGAGGKMKNIENTYRKGLLERGVVKELPQHIDALNAATRLSDHSVLFKSGLCLGGMALGVTYLACEALSAEKNWWKKDKEANPEAKKGKRAATPGLNVLERITEGLNSPSTMSLHRTSCALGMTIGGYIGMQVSNTMAGRELSGKPLDISEIPEYLEWGYKKLAYNPHSDHATDRWRYIAHFGVPAVFAMAGIIAASDLFFRSRKRKVSSGSEYLEDFENRATMAEANSWTPITALSALVVTPSGFGFLPFPAPNYGASLGTRFMLASGRKGVMPGLGELWTHSTAPYAEGPVSLRDRMIKYAINNPDPHPEQLGAMARGIVLQWFPDATPAQVQQFVDKVEQDRDKFYQEGLGIPQIMKDDCYNLLASHFKNEGLEQTFREMGQDPLKAVLGNNGLAGAIASKLSGADEMKGIRADYETRYKDRNKELFMVAQPQQPGTLIEPLKVEKTAPLQAAEPQLHLGA